MYYLYNGERLPELPEYDTAAYPYAVLDKTNAGTSFLFYAFKSRPYYGTNPADSTRRGVYSTGGAKVYYFVPADGGNEWVHQMDTDNPFTAENGNENTLFWTNVDILNEVDGSVWLAASAPVPVAEANWRDSFLLGLAMGLTGKPLHFVQMEPVAYLYNGVRLPPLPEWDKEVYPYAFIGHSFVNDSWTLYITKDNPVRRENDTQNGIRIYTYYHPDLLKTLGQWERVIGNPTTGSLFIPTDENGEAVIEIVWTNTDILNEDGSLYLATSTPVPVYE